MTERNPYKVLYAELTPDEFLSRLARAPIAYLPLGTLEWHGEHLPLGSDGIQAQGFFVELARQVGGIVLPPLFLGPDEMKTFQEREFFGMDLVGFQDGKPYQFPGSAYWVSDDLFKAMLEAILKQLKRAGFRIVVAHGHTPSVNLFNKFMGEWGNTYRLELYTCFRDDESDGFGIQTDHAAANETSLVMALRPELVQMTKLPQNRDEWPAGVAGKDPRQHASAETGRTAIDMQVKRMSELLLQALTRCQL